VSETPLVVHVLRPYATVEEYLEAEAWTIETRSMLLIDAAELPLDTTVLFDVSIQGEKLIRAEGRVAALVTPEGDTPGGLRVRFKRYGASTKAFIDRAVNFQKQRTEADQQAPAPSIPEPSTPSVPELVTPSIVTSAPLAAPSPPSAPVSAGTFAPEVRAPSQPPPASARTEAIREPSGIHRRPLSDGDVPANRDELLARLRERAKNLSRDHFGDSERGTG
jgi:hypothetical protein